MKVIAIIQDSKEIEKIIACLEKRNRLALSPVERSPTILVLHDFTGEVYTFCRVSSGFC